VILEPGEAVTSEYQLWDDYQVEGYMSPDEHRFKTERSLAEPNGVLAGFQFEWSFTVQVERP
jgi:hypothetical protein